MDKDVMATLEFAFAELEKEVNDLEGMLELIRADLKALRVLIKNELLQTKNDVS